MISLVSWNIAKRHQPWRDLVSMGDVDVALIQEAGRVAPDVSDRVWLGPESYYDSHRWNSRWYEGRFPRLLDR